MQGYVELVEEIPLSAGTEEAGRSVPDGLRYHVLDCWVEELDKVDKGREGPVGVFMAPVRRVQREGGTKVLRKRAGETLADGRLVEWVAEGNDGMGEGRGGGGAENEGDEKGEEDDDDDEWGGLED